MKNLALMSGFNTIKL